MRVIFTQIIILNHKYMENFEETLENNSLSMENETEQEQEPIVITDENYADYIGLDIVAFLEEEPGAQGCPGEVTILTREGKVYSTNYHINNLISWDNLIKVVPQMEGALKGEVEGWGEVGLSIGHSLFIKDEITEEFIKLHGSSFDDPCELDCCWENVIDSILNGEFKKGE